MLSLYINYENLARMADYIETIPQNMFTMSDYINEDAVENYRTGFTAIKHTVEHKCNTVGCTIGHCIALDPNAPRFKSGEYKYDLWVYQFTGIEPHSPEFNYLFGMHWAETDNTPKGAAERIRTFIASGIPVSKGWGSLRPL